MGVVLGLKVVAGQQNEELVVGSCCGWGNGNGIVWLWLVVTSLKVVREGQKIGEKSDLDVVAARFGYLVRRSVLSEGLLGLLNVLQYLNDDKNLNGLFCFLIDRRDGSGTWLIER